MKTKAKQTMEDIYQRMAINSWWFMKVCIGEAWESTGLDSEQRMIYAEGYAAEAKHFEQRAKIVSTSGLYQAQLL